jgi:ABC-type transporter Mla subunit MlaD
MKQLIVVVALAVGVLAGCGPTQEQQKMLADLTTEVTSMVNTAQSSLGNLDNMAGELTSALSQGDSLAKKFPKDAPAIDAAVARLKSAGDRVTAVKGNVSAWIENYKAPDLTKLKFDEAISDLKKNKDDLTAATSEIQGALSAATDALNNYKGVAAGLMTKVVGKK